MSPNSERKPEVKYLTVADSSGSKGGAYSDCRNDMPNKCTGAATAESGLQAQELFIEPYNNAPDIDIHHPAPNEHQISLK